MFPSPRSDDELAYQILFDPRQQNMISQDLILDYNHTLLEANNHCHNNVNNNCSSSRKRKQSGTLLLASAKTHPEKGDGDDEVKKIVHRDIERKRRKEMATLYASLRSLLPLEYVNKKKRSVSDHMYEAVNYIKQMHNNLKELERRRDSISHASSSNTTSPGYVSVSRCRDGGMEILVDTGCKLDERCPLSTLLRTLLNEGVEVMSCVSTKTSYGRLLHKIHSKVVCGEICVDVRALQQKLSCVINPAMWTQSLMVS